jgi:tRNA A37 threonylcarbamoyladenosine modification protein TsaB
MELFIDAHDLSFMSLGFVDQGRLEHEQDFAVSPEQYLATVDRFLTMHKVARADIKKMYVVPGPGSFTASRVSVTIANAIAFALDIPIVSVKNRMEIPATGMEQPSLVPVYDRPPNITMRSD